MKITNTRSLKSTKGMTLLELTVVILVLLSLISILFVGARAWKRGSDRAANIMNIRNVQQAVRGHQNMYNLNAGDALLSTTIFSSGTAGGENYLKTPTSPVPGTAGIVYAYMSVVPAIGTLYTTVTYGADAPSSIYAPVAGSYSDW